MAMELSQPQDVLVGRSVYTPPFKRRRNLPAIGNLMNSKIVLTTATELLQESQDVLVRGICGGVYIPPFKRRRNLPANENLTNSKIVLTTATELLHESQDELVGGLGGGGGVYMPPFKRRKMDLNNDESKKSVSDFYAGWSFYTSPSPRSVPMPSFFDNKSWSEITPLDYVFEESAMPAG